MNIEEAKKHIGAEVVLLEHTKPYMKELNQSIANIPTNHPPSKLVIDRTSNNVVVVKSPENHSYTLNPEHIAFRVIENLDVEVVAVDTPSSKDVFLDYKLEKKPVHEWDIDDAFYANNHGEEVEAFCGKEWILLDDLTVAIARTYRQFRIKPKQVFLNAGTYYEEDLVRIINDNFKNQS